MDDQKTNGDAVDIIECEGVGYAVLHYTSGSTFRDPKTASLWDAADEALKALCLHLENDTGREVCG